MYSRLHSWWQDNPSDPDRPSLDNPDVQQLIQKIDAQSKATDLGGTMSLNVLLKTSALILRVHQPFVSKRRISALQEVRLALTQQGLLVPTPVDWQNQSVLRCGSRWAELETYVNHTRLQSSLSTYNWIFHTMGLLHRHLSILNVTVPRPLVATYAPPSSLRRWLSVTHNVVQSDTEAANITHLIHTTTKRLRNQWQPASSLPQQLIHGDIRPSNICQTQDGKTVYLDFGFLAHRPRIHDLAYAIAFMVRDLQNNLSPEHFSWHLIPHLIKEYESTAPSRLTIQEKNALVPYIAAVPLYAAALDGFSNNPIAQLQNRLPFIQISAWLLTHPEAILG